MSDYLLGIDNGGTFTKATLYDAHGNSIRTVARSIPTVMPAPGFVERDMELLWRETCAVVRETVGGAGVDRARIAGIACTGHGKGLYLWGRDGKPVGKGILSASDSCTTRSLRCGLPLKSADASVARRPA